MRGSISRLIADANPLKGWGTPYRVAMVVMAAVYILMGAALITPPRALSAQPRLSTFASVQLASVDLSGLPKNPTIGSYYYTAWRYHYINKYGTYEYSLSKNRANYASTWQTTSTWPGSSLVQQERHLLLYNGYLWDIAATWVRNTGLFSLWGVQCDISYRFNGAQVFSDNSNTCHAWGTGFGVAVTPVTWNDGGAYWGGLSFGADYRVSVVASGTPIFFDHWMRVTIHNNGSVALPTGG